MGLLSRLRAERRIKRASEAFERERRERMLASHVARVQLAKEAKARGGGAWANRLAGLRSSLVKVGEGAQRAERVLKALDTVGFDYDPLGPAQRRQRKRERR